MSRSSLGDDFEPDQVLGRDAGAFLAGQHGLQRADRHRELIEVGLARGQVLQHQPGVDVRDALLGSARTDSNAAVRIKALEGLRQFTDDPVVRHEIESIVKEDSNPEVRSEAIDILLPAELPTQVLAPDVLTTLQEIVNSERQDDYVHSRSLQVLRTLGASAPVY